MPTVDEIASLLERFAPLDLAEDWDNVGLLVGDRSAEVARLMTCLTLTPASVGEAIDRGAQMVVAHHPLPFRPLRRLTSDTPEGQMLLGLIGAQVAVYSPHTAFDSAAAGINQHLAEALQLEQIAPLVAHEAVPGDPPLGSGRFGNFDRSLSLEEVAARLKQFLSLDRVRAVGRAGAGVERVAVACGSGGSLLAAARDCGCDCFVTGETSFHTCLEAESTDIALLLTGHFASERFAVERLAEHLQHELPKVECWASQREADPLLLL